jgi:methylated-DNA-[protein]-cysteine S-methyltransferase
MAASNLLAVNLLHGPTCEIAFETPLGAMTATLGEAGLVRLAFVFSPASSQPQRDGPHADAAGELAERLKAYARGKHVDFDDFPLDFAGLTPFRRAVTEACRKIGYGKVISYRELARRAGHPDAARAVGQVMATNRWPIIVPCHRIIASGGSLGGYSAPNGLMLKKRLLALEQGTPW